MKENFEYTRIKAKSVSTFTKVSILRFGKHKGDSIELVCATDPTYIEWALEKGIFKLDKPAMKLYDEAMSELEDRRGLFGFPHFQSLPPPKYMDGYEN